MKQWLLRFIAIAVLVVLGLWLWHSLFPNPEKIILDRLTQVAKLASFESNEGEIARLQNVLSLVGYFTTDTDCVFDSPDLGQWEAHGRSNLRDSALAARSMLVSLHVEFFDTAISLADDKKSAIVRLTVRASRPGDRDFVVKVVKFTMRNVSGDWLIARAETVKVLS